MRGERPRLVLRADGSRKVGLGHVRRCLAVAQAAAGWADAELLVAGDEAVLCLAEDVGVPAFLVPPTFDATLHRARGAAALVVDSYAIDHADLAAARGATRVLAFDDTGDFPIPADFVVNPAAGLVAPDGTDRYLLGPCFAPLSPEFALPSDRPPSDRVERVLIVLGGATPAAVAASAARAVRTAVPAASPHIVVGPVGSGVEDIAAALGDTTGVVFHRSPRAMRELMVQSDVAVAAAGVTLLELLASGVPTVSLPLADNQERNLRGLAARGAVVDVPGWADDFEGTVAAAVGALAASPERRRALAARARETVDGRGAERIVSALRAALGDEVIGAAPPPRSGRAVGRSTAP